MLSLKHGSLILVAVLSGGCGAARPVEVSHAATSPAVATASVSEPDADAESEVVPTAATAAESRISPEAREDIALFAYSTLQLQRVALLQDRRIQQELKLAEKDIARFTRLAKEVEQMRSALQTLSGEARREKLMTEYRPKCAEYERLVDEALDDAQERTLFKRILQKQPGAIIFLMPGVAEELELSPEQQESIYVIVETTRQSVNFNNLSSPIEKARILWKATAARKEAEGTLTAEQRADWERLMAD